jgi:hypothetical protein
LAEPNNSWPEEDAITDQWDEGDEANTAPNLHPASEPV